MSEAIDRADLRWTDFAIRLVAGMVWLLSAAAFVTVGAAQGSESLVGLRIACAAGIALPPVAWAISLRRRRARADELERSIINDSLGAAAVFVLTWDAFMAAFAIVHPAPFTGYRQNMMALLLAESPSMALVVSELRAQMRRRDLVRPIR